MSNNEIIKKGSGGTFSMDQLKANKDLLQNQNLPSDMPKRKYNVKPKSKKSSIRLFVNKSSIEEFRDFGGKFFKNNNALHEFSSANFLRNIMVNLQEYFIKNNGGVMELNENQLMFLKSPAKRIENVANYPHISKEAVNTSFTIEEELIEILYRLAYTFYHNERQNLYHYSLSFFFYDILQLLESKKLKLKYYTKTQIENYFQLNQ